jgi:hypothetical protein
VSALVGIAPTICWFGPSIVSDVLYASKDDKLIKLLLTESDWICIDQLDKSLETFERSYIAVLYVGIEPVIQKLDHYFEKVSPMVGIALPL